MTRALKSNAESDVLSLLREWVGLLARSDFEEARDWLFRAEDLTADDLKEWIFRYRSDYRGARRDERNSFAPTINLPEEVGYEGEEFHYEPLLKADAAGNEVVAVEYYLPVDGEWSPMRASFFLRQTDGGEFALELTDISMD